MCVYFISRNPIEHTRFQVRLCYENSYDVCKLHASREHATLVFHVRVCYDKYVCQITSCEFHTLSELQVPAISLVPLGRQTIGLLRPSASCDVNNLQVPAISLVPSAGRLQVFSGRPLPVMLGPCEIQLLNSAAQVVRCSSWKKRHSLTSRNLSRQKYFNIIIPQLFQLT